MLGEGLICCIWCCSLLFLLLFHFSQMARSCDWCMINLRAEHSMVIGTHGGIIFHYVRLSKETVLHGRVTTALSVVICVNIVRSFDSIAVGSQLSVYAFVIIMGIDIHNTVLFTVDLRVDSTCAIIS